MVDGEQLDKLIQGKEGKLAMKVFKVKEKQRKESAGKRKKIAKEINRLARKKVSSKRVFKKSKATLHLSSKPVPSSFDQGSHFFTDEVEDAEMALFFR